MSLRAIVKAVGGDLYDRGRRANIPAPGHSPKDRSVSLLLEAGRVIIHTFGAEDWRAARDSLRELGLIDDRGWLAPVAGRSCADAPPTLGAPERRLAARAHWEAARAITGTASVRYCRSRNVKRDLPADTVLRHHPAAPLSAYRGGGATRPALLAAISDPSGGFSAVEMTYLGPDGRRASDLRLPRKTIGPAPGGCAIRLDAEAADMLVAEGVFTTLSATERFGLPGWALMSTRNLRAWSAPAGVRSVLIAADRGKDGEASAAILRDRLQAAGVAAAVALPPSPYGDWNEWSVGMARSAGRRG